MISVEEIKKEKLRTGYTTGTSATAAAKAALLAIINQTKIENVDVKLPKGSFIKIPIHLCQFDKNGAKCSVIKDGGDDPDVTHGAEIVVELSFTDKINEIEIDGGEGVGIVTKPGLGLELNKAAINPVPKKMIKENLREITDKYLVRKEIKKAYVVGFIGKLAKMSAGVKQTHVKGSKVDMNFLAELAKKCNANK